MTECINEYVLLVVFAIGTSVGHLSSGMQFPSSLSKMNPVSQKHPATHCLVQICDPESPHFAGHPVPHCLYSLWSPQVHPTPSTQVWPTGHKVAAHDTHWAPAIESSVQNVPSPHLIVAHDIDAFCNNLCDALIVDINPMNKIIAFIVAFLRRSKSQVWMVRWDSDKSHCIDYIIEPIFTIFLVNWQKLYDRLEKSGYHRVHVTYLVTISEWNKCHNVFVVNMNFILASTNLIGHVSQFTWLLSHYFDYF